MWGSSPVLKVGDRSPRRTARKCCHDSGPGRVFSTHIADALGINTAACPASRCLTSREDARSSRSTSAESLSAGFGNFGGGDGGAIADDNARSQEGVSTSSRSSSMQLPADDAPDEEECLQQQLRLLQHPFLVWLSSSLTPTCVADPEMLRRRAEEHVLKLDCGVGSVAGALCQARVPTCRRRASAAVQDTPEGNELVHARDAAQLLFGALRETARAPGVRLPVALWLQALVRASERKLCRADCGKFLLEALELGVRTMLRSNTIPSAPPSRRVQRGRVARKNKCAYAALLHGWEEDFFVYALLVGHCLARHSPGVDRVLLCAGRWWNDRGARAALSRVYTFVRPVGLIRAGHTTLAPRHAEVFTKIQALRLPYRHLLFLDLDLVICGDPSPLFRVKAPAGLYHGGWRGRLRHGQLISKAVSWKDWWCVNAGVMRLDPSHSRKARRHDVDSMIAEVRRITWRTMLPEQYYLARRLEGWRHLEQRWNMEVGPQYNDPGFQRPQRSARRRSVAPRGWQWFEQDVRDVRIFHFSGRNLEPWWYADVSAEQAYAEAATEWRHRDPRRLMAVAIREWRVALDKLLDASEHWTDKARAPLQEAVQALRQRATDFREWRSTSGAQCFKCQECRQHFTSRKGRWVSRRRSKWACCDCIVASVLRDDTKSQLQS